MIWSIIPEEMIFDGAEKLNKNKYQVINYKGKKVMVMIMPNGDAQIVSLLSSNPLDFIDQRFSPGSCISLSWSTKE